MIRPPNSATRQNGTASSPSGYYESSNALACLIGVSLTSNHEAAKAAAHSGSATSGNGGAQESSRFAFATSNASTQQSGTSSSGDGLGNLSTLHQALPNVNISYGDKDSGGSDEQYWNGNAGVILPKSRRTPSLTPPPHL